MEEKASKVISLRKKRNARPAISAPRPQVLPQSFKARPAAAPTPERPQTRDTTSDLVKRRYSARFENPPPGFDPAAPPIPALPHGIDRAGARQPPAGSRDAASSRPPITVDAKALQDPNLQAEPYITTLLSDATDQELLAYQSNLQRLRNRTSTDLKQNVYQNRTQFIKISKEAEKLKAEMRTLRHLMTELRANTNALSQESLGKGLTGAGPDLADPDSERLAARKRANRSSVANLEAMWNSQLQTLWKNVEGSQKFLPAVPGRHVIRDSPHWVELNPATWKARRAIHIFLLNDHLLVASRKRKRGDQSADASDPTTGQKQQNQQQQPVISKLVAERCWPLQDIEMVDLSSKLSSMEMADGQPDHDSTSRAINIRVGQESFTYRNDRSDGGETATLLLAYRKAVDELLRSLRLDVAESTSGREKPDQAFGRPETTLSARAQRPDSRTGFLRDKASIVIEIDGQQRNMRWVESQFDELDIALALQRFKEAVEGIEKLRHVANELKDNVTAQQHVIAKTRDRAEKVADVLLRQLSETHSFLNATQKNVGWLMRLGFEERSREVYLAARSASLTKRARQCIFEGNLPHYIFQISFIFFTTIKNTVNIFQSCFPAVMMSACVKWAKEQVDEFNQILARQMSTVEQSSDIWQECMECVREHASSMVEVGLEFRHLVGVGMDTDGRLMPTASPNGPT